MKHRSFMLALSVIVVLGLAAPALANPAGGRIIVIPGGTFTAGKFRSPDNPADGCDSVSGAGLGAPVVSQAKNAYYKLTADVTVFNNGIAHAGVMNVCGRLLPVLDNLIKVPGNTKKGIGASCELSKGHDGRGLLLVPSKAPMFFWMSDVGWKITAGRLVPITGKIHTGGGVKGGGKVPVDGFVGAIWLLGHDRCHTKRDNPKLQGLSTGPKLKDSDQGQQVFMVMGAIVVVPGGASLGNRNDRPGSPKGSNDMPFFCKKEKDGPESCAYKTKKPGQ